MNAHYTDRDLHEPVSNDREISLGTSTILGIFLALALLCGAFFGFGYSLGRKSAQPAIAPPAAATTSDVTPTPKPSPATTQPSGLRTLADADPTPAPAESTPEPTPPSASLRPAALTKATPPPPLPTTAAPIPGSPIAMVQVAAISRQDDADLMVSSLKRKGYTVSIRHEPQDKLLHIQIGPYASRKDAELMRQKLISDGYNAILK